MNIAVVGATWATRTLIDALERHDLPPYVFGQNFSPNIAGWEDLEPDVWFDKINDQADTIRELAPEYLFVCGCSQMVSREVRIRAGRCIGFHPTRLPSGRGRAPIPWMILGAAKGAATFFRLEDTPDSGPVFMQEPFDVGPNDYAQDVCDRIVTAMDAALDFWLPYLEEWPAKPQDETYASYLGVRRPEDGRLDWSRSASELQRLVRASSRPYPGAFSGETRVWRASVADEPYRGVVGRVVAPGLVQCGDGLLRLDESEGPELKVGAQL